MNLNLKTVEQYSDASGFTEPQLRAYIARAHENGLLKLGGVKRIGRRVWINVDQFERWIDQQTASKTGIEPDHNQALAA